MRTLDALTHHTATGSVLDGALHGEPSATCSCPHMGALGPVAMLFGAVLVGAAIAALVALTVFLIRRSRRTTAIVK